MSRTGRHVGRWFRGPGREEASELLDELVGCEREHPAMPSEEQAQAVWTQVQASVAVGAGAATGAVAGTASAKAASPALAAGKASVLAKVVVAGALAGAGAVVIVAQTDVSHSSAESPGTSPKVAVEAERGVSPGEFEGDEPMLDSSAAVELIHEGERPSDRASSRDEPKSAPGHGPKSPDHRTDRGSLNRELALLERARAALRADAPKRALAIIRAHARHYRRSALAEEREALRLIALCEAKEFQRAGGFRRRFFQRWPSSVHALKVEQACAAATDTDDG